MVEVTTAPSINRKIFSVNKSISESFPCTPYSFTSVLIRSFCFSLCCLAKPETEGLPSPISETNNVSSEADTLLTDLPSLSHTINFDQRCEAIEAYLLDHLIEKQVKKYLKLLLMLQELDADSSAMPSSYKTLSRLFQEVIGISPKEYVQIKRINQSLALFASTKDIKSQDLADQLGYYDSAHFINEFKKYTGKTPKSLKNSLFDMKDSEFIDEFKQYISPEHLLHYTSIFHKNL